MIAQLLLHDNYIHNPVSRRQLQLSKLTPAQVSFSDLIWSSYWTVNFQCSRGVPPCSFSPYLLPSHHLLAFIAERSLVTLFCLWLCTYCIASVDDYRKILKSQIWVKEKKSKTLINQQIGILKHKDPKWARFFFSTWNLFSRFNVIHLNWAFTL